MAGEDDARTEDYRQRAWAQLASLVAMTSFGAERWRRRWRRSGGDLWRPDRPTDNAVRIELRVDGRADAARDRRKAPTPAARVMPANPDSGKVLGQIAPSDPKAPPIKFQVNLPIDQIGRSLQYGGGGLTAC